MDEGSGEREEEVGTRKIGSRMDEVEEECRGQKLGEVEEKLGGKEGVLRSESLGRSMD